MEKETFMVCYNAITHVDLKFKTANILNSWDKDGNMFNTSYAVKFLKRIKEVSEIKGYEMDMDTGSIVITVADNSGEATVDLNMDFLDDLEEKYSSSTNISSISDESYEMLNKLSKEKRIESNRKDVQFFYSSACEIANQNKMDKKIENFLNDKINFDNFSWSKLFNDDKFPLNEYHTPELFTIDPTKKFFFGLNPLHHAYNMMKHKDDKNISEKYRLSGGKCDPEFITLLSVITNKGRGTNNVINRYVATCIFANRCMIQVKKGGHISRTAQGPSFANSDDSIAVLALGMLYTSMFTTTENIVEHALMGTFLCISKYYYLRGMVDNNSIASKKLTLLQREIFGWNDYDYGKDIQYYKKFPIILKKREQREGKKNKERKNLIRIN